MKKISLSLYLFLLLFFVCSAQQTPPAVQWQKCLGGGGSEYNGRIVRSSDGGYVVVSSTNSVNDGDVTPHPATSNIWLVKFNNTGAIVWQKYLPGAGFFALDLKNTMDGGYVIAGTAVNDNTIPGYHASYDAMIIKVAGDGTPQWQRCYGGSQIDGASAVQPTKDGGYIFSGETSSRDGDVAGAHAGIDIWVVKIDKLGSIQWQKCLGGQREDHGNGGSIIRTNDNGYMLIGTTVSSNGDISGFHGSTLYSDAWVVKLDSAGNILWQKCLGGSNVDQGNDIIQLTDDSYIAAITTTSSDGDLNYNHNIGGAYTSDIGIIALNKDGAVLWQKCLGGKQGETVNRIKQAVDGNFVIAGGASSFDGDVSGVHSPPGYINSGNDAWLVKINTAGNILWQKPFGGSNTDVMTDFCLTDDGEVVFAAYTQSGSDGDIVGSHNSLSIQNSLTDMWVVKTGGLNTIKGVVFIDYNANGIKDGNDALVKKALVKSEKPGYNWQTAVNNGSFSNKVDTGTFVTSLILDKPYYTIIPVSKQSSFTSFFGTDSTGFSLVPVAGKRDYRINLLPLTPARPGFWFVYKIKFDNAGTDTLVNRTVQLIKDKRTSFEFASAAPTGISGDTLKWNIGNLMPADSGSIVLYLAKSSSALYIGDSLKFIASIDTTGDLVTSDNVSLLRQRVTGGFDPNDKLENFGGIVTPADIAANKRLTYTIRFQNTGNDTAFNIIVRDTLDAKTALNSIEMIDASHPYQLNIKDGRYCTWQFSNIKLVDSVHNQPLSHGYLSYSIKPAATFVLGDTIKNSASIYFDFNSPVKTNNQFTILRRIDPPPMPVVTGLQRTYCIASGIQKAKITNLPSLNSDIIVSVKLYTTLLPVAADSTFSFDPSALAAGTYDIIVLFSNSTGADTLLYNISIKPLVTPDVKISANINSVVNLTDPVVVTATNASGGGPSPKYTFAKDKGMTNILQAEGTANTLTIQPNTLMVGSNWMYVRMKTSDTCYTSQSDIDSINIERSTITGITDPDFPRQQINIFPNPFSQVINIGGLNRGKTYTVIISNAAGQKIYIQQVSGSSIISVNKTGLPNGRYLVSLYDYRKHLLIGTAPLIKN